MDREDREKEENKEKNKSVPFSSHPLGLSVKEKRQVVSLNSRSDNDTSGWIYCPYLSHDK